MKSIKLYGFVLAVLTALAPAAHAQFGSGIVYDPTQSAHAVQEIEQGEQQLQKWATELNNWQQHLLKEAQIFTTAEQTRTQIVTMYNLAYQMATMPQNLEARYKADWAQWQSLAAPPNTYGNTSPLVNALNFGGLPQAQQGYSSAYVQVQATRLETTLLSTPGPRPPSPTSTPPRSWRKRPRPTPSRHLERSARMSRRSQPS